MRALQGFLGSMLSFILLSSCTSPTYVVKEEGSETLSDLGSQVIFKVTDAYKENPPDCVAVLPFDKPGKDSGEKITVDQAEAVRRAFYAHLSPQGKRDIEIPRIDFVVSKMDVSSRKEPSALGENLRCMALVRGDVIEYSTNFFGVYSRVAVGANLNMVRADDGAILWEGRHVAQSHGGSVPLSPIGLAMGIIEAANNVRDEQILRIIDDLARRLVNTIPDDRIAVLDEPLTPVIAKTQETIEKPESVDDFLASLDGRSSDEKKTALLAAIEENTFPEGKNALFEELIAVSPDEPDGHALYARYLIDEGDYSGSLEQVDKALAFEEKDHSLHFLKGRVLIKMDKLDAADTSIVKAAALEETNADYLNGLGYVNSLLGNDDRALAAYTIAINRDPSNGFAYYNIGVTQYNRGDLEEAADAFYGAGLAYIKSKNYGPATKALTDLIELSEGGVDRAEEIKFLEEALKSLTNGGKNNG